MLESGWLFIGTVSLVVTLLAVVTPDDAWAIVLGTAGTIGWGLFSYGALDVTVVDSGTYSFTQSSVTLFGLVMALIPLYIALTGPVELVGRATDNPRAEDL